MKIILPSFQANFTAADLAFVGSVLAPRKTGLKALASLLCDNDTLYRVLSNEQLYEAILEQPHHLEISTHLFFYILVNQALKKVGIFDGELTDYLACLLSDKVHANTDTRMSPRSALFYAVDLLEKMQSADSSQQFALMAQIANQSLFVTGIFPEHLNNRKQYRAAPDIAYYTSIGSTHYKAAQTHRLAAEFHLEKIFGTLGNRFEDARQALNTVGENLVFLHQSERDSLSKWLLN